MKISATPSVRLVVVATTAFLVSCGGGGGGGSTPNVPAPQPSPTSAPTSGTGPQPTASPTLAPSAAPTMTPIPTPSPTPTQFVFVPATIDFANVAYDQSSPPPSGICPSPNGPNVVCLNGYGPEVNPSQLGYSIGSGRWNPTTSNASVAVASDCGYSTYPYAGVSLCSGNPRSILVYPTGVGSSTVSVHGGNGLTGSFPITVSSSNVSVAVSGLPQATYLDIRGYRSTDGATLFGTGISITNPASDPTVFFYNINIPVNVSMTIQITVSNGLQIYATSTIYNQNLPSQMTHAISMTVSPTTR